ncbi:MAG: hypothetical protein U5L00_05415 [Desulfovermiculus sp.]|nr:hypothetical protein [Desulfovermiculus sp.]
MSRTYRTSPVRFDASPVQSEERDGWTVVLEYAEEKDGPWLIDLSHLPRWDVQDRDLSQYQPCGLDIPESPGMCVLGEKVTVNRMNRTQASIWHLGPNGQDMPQERAYTDIRENTLCLALLGPKAQALSEKVTNLDLADPKRKTPCLIQGPMAHVPCQIVLLSSDRHKQPGFVFTCSRGYARDVVHTLLAAGEEFGLRPAGEGRIAASGPPLLSWAGPVQD